MEEEESFWLFLSLAPAPSPPCRLWRAWHYQMFPGNVQPFCLAPSHTFRWCKLPARFLNICCLCIPLQGDLCSLQIKQCRGKFSVWIADFCGGGEPLDVAVGMVLGRQLTLLLCAWACPHAASAICEQIGGQRTLGFAFGIANLIQGVLSQMSITLFWCLS